MDSRSDNSLTLEGLRKIQREWVEERDWDQFHMPRNLVLAMVGEVGEVAELFQWKSDEFPSTNEQRERVGEELSDVLLYLVRLADKCDINLSEAVLSKIELNSRKYPVSKAKGSSKKYTEL